MSSMRYAESLSLLMDNEADERQLQVLLNTDAQVLADTEKWHSYHLARAILREEPCFPKLGIHRMVSAIIDQESALSDPGVLPDHGE